MRERTGPCLRCGSLAILERECADDWSESTFRCVACHRLSKAWEIWQELIERECRPQPLLYIRE